MRGFRIHRPLLLSVILGDAAFTIYLAILAVNGDKVTWWVSNVMTIWIFINFLALKYDGVN
jgi:hypothetical protein